MDKRDLYLKVLAVIKAAQEEQLKKALMDVSDELKKARGEEKQNRRAAAAQEDKARGIPKYKDMGTHTAPNRPNEGHHFGINRQMPNRKEGTSVVGHHIKEKTTPVIPVKEQIQDTLQSLKGAPKPNLPKSELQKDGGSAGFPTSRIDTGFGRIIAKGGTAGDPQSRPDKGFGAIIVKDEKAEPLGKPYASNAQRKKFHAMENRGEISHATVKEWDKESKGKKLPEHVAKADLEKAKIYDIKSGKMTADLGQPEHTTPPKGDLKAVTPGFQPTKKLPVNKPARKQKIAAVAKEPMAKVDPKTSLPGVLINKASSAPAPAVLPKPGTPPAMPKMGMKPIPKIKAPPKSPGASLSMAETSAESMPAAVLASEDASLNAPAQGPDVQMNEDKAAHLKSWLKKCMMQKSWPMKKDDKPHPRGTPAWAAHEVKEHGVPLKEELQSMHSKDEKKELMDHLQTLNDPKNLRSPKNVK